MRANGRQSLAMATATVFGISLGYIFAQYFGKEVKNSGKEEEKSNGPRYGGLRFFKADEDAEQVKRIVKFLVSHAKNARKESLDVRKIDGGRTNRLYRVGFPEGSPVLVRVFGAEGMIDRMKENQTYIWLASEGIAPKYYGRYENGRIEQFFDGYVALTLDDMRDPKIFCAVAEELGRIHKLKLPPAIQTLHPEVGLWDQLNTWLQHAKSQRKKIPPSLLSSPLPSPFATPTPSGPSTPSRHRTPTTPKNSEKNPQNSEEILEKSKNIPENSGNLSLLVPGNPLVVSGNCSGGDEKRNSGTFVLGRESVRQYCSIDFNRCALAIKNLKKSIEGSKAAEMAVFCHNDLLCGNILKKIQGKGVRFVDFEYGGLGLRGFDIANHFNEWAGGTLEGKGPGYNGIPDYTRFPSDREQRMFCGSYLREALSRSPTQKEIDSLIQEALWAVNSSFDEGCEEFDYMQYAVIRIMRGLEDQAW